MQQQYVIVFAIFCQVCFFPINIYIVSVKAESCMSQFFKLHTKAYTESFLQLMLGYLCVKSNVETKLFYVD